MFPVNALQGKVRTGVFVSFDFVSLLILRRLDSL